MAILIELPYTDRPFAPPILVALSRDKKTNAAEGRRHKTPAELMCGLLALLMHWFPERKRVFAGDNAYGSHAVARFAKRHDSRNFASTSGSHKPRETEKVERRPLRGQRR